MAKTKNGLNGQVSGKVGNVVYSSWRGIPYVRAAPSKRAAPSEKEKANHWIFGELTQGWITPIAEFLKIGFKGYTQTNQGLTAAKSYLYRNALHQDGFNSTIDPALMLVSYGSLANPEEASVGLNDQKELVFTWNPTTGRNQSQRDQALLLAYNVEKEKAKMSLAGEFRSTGTDLLDLSTAEPGVYHVYMAFLAQDRSRQSNSMYLGTVTL